MRQIVVERRERHGASGEGGDIRFVRRGRGRRVIGGPKVGSAPRIDAPFKRLAIPGSTHRHHPHLRLALEGGGGDVDVVEATGRGLSREKLFDHLHGHSRRPIEVGMFVKLQRHRNARDAEEGPFHSRAHRARIEHIDSRIEAAVDTAHHQIGPPGKKLRYPQLHRVGRAAIHRKAPAAVAVKDLLGGQRSEKRDRVADPALLSRRGDHAHLTDPFQRSFQRSETGGEDAVVVGEQSQHRGVHQVHELTP